MRYQPANLLGGFYSDSSKPWSVQDTVNWIPEVATQPGTRTQAKLRTAPGLKPFVEIGPAPIRGSHNCEGKLFVVSGNRLYQISNTGVAIPLGTIPGTGLVQMSHNQRSGGNELIVVTGTAGYVYNTRTLVFERISDPGYPGAGSVDYIDQYLVQVEPFGRFWLHSDLANALEYSTLDRYESEASPDKIVTIITNNLEVVVFNETTTEFFDNTGAATNTFQNKRAVIDVGCAGRNAVAKIDRSLIWLGNDGVVYYLEGYSARPISNPPIEQAISGFNWASAIANVYESEGHKIFYLTFPGGLTFGYDVVTQIWHRRASFGMDRWRINTLTYWNRKWIAGDFQNGRLYELDWKYPLEGDQPLVRERTSGVTHSNQNRITVPYLELLMGAGQPEVLPTAFPAQPTGPTITGDAPSGPVDEPYEYQYTLTPGSSPIVSVKASPLPEGWSISNTGLLTGVMPEDGVPDFVVRATDANGLWDELTDRIDFVPLFWWYVTWDDEANVRKSESLADLATPIWVRAGGGGIPTAAFDENIFGVINSGEGAWRSTDDAITVDSLTSVTFMSPQVNQFVRYNGRVYFPNTGGLLSMSESGTLTAQIHTCPSGQPRGLTRKSGYFYITYTDGFAGIRIYRSPTAVNGSWVQVFALADRYYGEVGSIDSSLDEIVAAAGSTDTGIYLFRSETGNPGSWTTSIIPATGHHNITPIRWSRNRWYLASQAQFPVVDTAGVRSGVSVDQMIAAPRVMTGLDGIRDIAAAGNEVIVYNFSPQYALSINGGTSYSLVAHRINAAIPSVRS